MEGFRQALSSLDHGELQKHLDNPTLRELASLRDKEGSTALHHCVQVANQNAQLMPVIRALIESRADIHARNDTGISPIDLCEPRLGGFLEACYNMSRVLRGLLPNDAFRGEVMPYVSRAATAVRLQDESLSSLGPLGLDDDSEGEPGVVLVDAIWEPREGFTAGRTVSPVRSRLPSYVPLRAFPPN
eukprot:RCo043956